MLDLAADLKDKKKKGIPVDTITEAKMLRLFLKRQVQEPDVLLKWRHMIMGMGTTYLDPSGSQIGKKESIEDTARVLGRMYDGIEYRGFGQEMCRRTGKICRCAGMEWPDK